MSSNVIFRWVAALALATAALPAGGAWGYEDRNGNRIDDAIDAVQTEGWSAAFEKGDPNLRMAIAAFREEGAAPTPFRYGIYVGYDHHPGEADAEALRAAGAPFVKPYLYIDYIRTEGTYAQIETIRDLPGVVRVEAIPMVYASNHYATRVVRGRDARGLKKAENFSLFPSARGDLGLDGTGIVVAILDTGVNDEPDSINAAFPGHESLLGKFLGGGSFFAGQPLLNTGLDAIMNPADHGAAASSYHATHVAGSAIGTGGQDGFYAGVAPAARLVDCKVLSDAGVGFGSTDGVEWCIHNKNKLWPGLAGADTIYRGIDVLSLSLGGTSSSDGSDASAQMLNAAVNAGFVVCVATGNDDSIDYIASPSSADLVISVGASVHGKTVTRTDDSVTTFSNEGVRLDDGDLDHEDEMKPSVVAPGQAIVSADGDFTSDGGAYKSLSGTSMSTPVVSGVCALLRQGFPELTPLQIRAILQNTAEHFTPTAKPTGQRPNDPFGLDPNYNPACGWGTADAYAAAKEAANSTSGVQVVRIRAVARPASGAIDVNWTTQREYPFSGFNVWRALDAGGVPGTYELVNDVLVAPTGDPVIQDDDNRTDYVFVDDDEALALGETYWYRVDWVDGSGAHSEPAVTVEFGQPPRVATVYYSIAHNDPDTDLSITYGSSETYNPLSSQYVRVGPSTVAEQDSVVAIGPANAATATIGNLDHYWSVPLGASDGALPFLPPGLTPTAHPWFLNVLEGHYVNRSGRITSFSIFVNDAPGSAGGTTYSTNSLLPAVTAEGMATTVWIPARATPVETSRMTAAAEAAGVRVSVDPGTRAGTVAVRFSRGASLEFASRAALAEVSAAGAGARIEYLDTDVRPGATYWYWAELVDAEGHGVMAGPISVRTAGWDRVESLARILGPNPLVDRAALEYTVGSDVAAAGMAPVRLTVHDVQGRLVRTLADGAEAAGRYRTEWDGRDDGGSRVGAGVYFLRYSAGAVTRTAKLSVVR